jgi:hypothetical protein
LTKDFNDYVKNQSNNNNKYFGKSILVAVIIAVIFIVVTITYRYIDKNVLELTVFENVVIIDKYTTRSDSGSNRRTSYHIKTDRGGYTIKDSFVWDSMVIGGYYNLHVSRVVRVTVIN